MAIEQITSPDRPSRNMAYDQVQRHLPLRAQRIEQEKHPRNPFDSPSHSTSSFDETDSGNTSGQDEFHLERYSSNAKYSRAGQISRAANNEEKQRPDLNIITSFTSPSMPMNSEAVRIDKVQAKPVRADRRLKALSIASHKAVQSAVSPPDQETPPHAETLGTRMKLTVKNSKRSKPIQRLQDAIVQRQKPPFTQRVPIGVTIPRENTATVEQNNGALSNTTPMTPAIVVTPAGEQKPWILQRRSTNEKDPASSIYSVMPANKFKHDLNVPPTPGTVDLDNVYMSEKQEWNRPRTSHDSSGMILSDGSDSERPVSQGWWNLMLSPLLRAGSLASRRGRQPTDTPPVPPLPFPRQKDDSPASSARSDPSFLVSPHETDPSPDTPRRQGLASARASTWSRWTKWENEREAGKQEAEEDMANQRDMDTEAGDGASIPVQKGTGLAAEYFHACAVEQLTGRRYFECINHDCVEQLPKLHSIHDIDEIKREVLASPFDEDRGLAPEPDIKTPDGVDAINSPSVLSDALSPNELSPNVRQASVVPVVKARALDSQSDKGSANNDAEKAARISPDKETSTGAAYSNSAQQNHDDLPNITTVAQADFPPPQAVEIKVLHEAASLPAASGPLSEKSLYEPAQISARESFTQEPSSEKARVAVEELASPSPMSPDGQRSLAPAGAVPLWDMDRKDSPAPAAHGEFPPRPAFITAETEYPTHPERMPTAPVTAQDLAPAPRRLSIEGRRQRLEKEDAAARRLGGLWRGRGCFPQNGCMGRGGPEGRTKRRWIFGVSLALLIIIVVSIVLAVTLTRPGDGTPVESQWLNLTGFPAMPTGILTIAAPRMVSEQKQCVSPTTMWSCAVPKEDRDQIGSNEPNQPNFRFKITFRNGTVPSNMTIPVHDVGNEASSSDLFVPNPSPPNQADQIFMGNTTDNVTAPFDGEKTPFFITFMPAFPVVPDGFNDSGKRLLRRQSNSSLLNAIPAPELADDGSAAPASLLPTTPFPISQPVRLYNRGLEDEHYGFYMYYDKSIYLSGLQLDENGVAQGSNDAANADQDGGSTKESAATRCTFAQTRFLFKIFTNPVFDGGLLPRLFNASSTTDQNQDTQEVVGSATNFEQPGSFPYPATVVLDRHGGDIDSKAVWCYGMDGGDIVKNLKILVGENRAFGGNLINASPSLSGNSSGFNSTAGGIDGGTGGCSCTWQNWA